MQLLNRLGKRSVEAGLGPAYFHNHNDEFSRRYTDFGASCPTTSTATNCKSSWEIIMDRTDPRWVVAQIDIGWAVCGSAFGTPPDAAAGMTYVTAMINKFTNRIVSYHFKDVDAAGIRLTCGNAEQREIGQGGINFAPMLAAARNRSKYYFMERDPVAVGGPTNFNPFTNTENALKAMRADPSATLFAAAPVIPSQPAGTIASAANAVPVVVTNDGDAPLTITTITLAAEANDGGNDDRDDFSIVSQNCFGTGNVGRWRRASSPCSTTRRRPTSTSRPRPSRPAPAPSTWRSSRRAPTTRRSRACSSRRTPTTASSACCSPPRAPATRSAPSAATSRACSP